jgi:hypothetical protein
MVVDGGYKDDWWDGEDEEKLCQKLARPAPVRQKTLPAPQTIQILIFMKFKEVDFYEV